MFYFRFIIFVGLLVFLKAGNANVLVTNFLSPFTTPAAFIMLSGGAGTALMYARKAKWTSHSHFEIVQHKPLGDFSTVGDLLGRVFPNALYVGEQLIFDRPDGYRRAEHMAYSTLCAGLFTGVLKYTVREKRPGSNSKTSFPSGHTTTAFAFASVVGIHHPWYIGTPAYLLASFVGFSRVNDNKHYVHDVLAGATIGTAFGYGVYYANKDRYDLGNRSSDFQLAPLFGPKTAGLILTFSY